MAPIAPSMELRWARRGTAYFARKLNELTDDQLDAPTLIPGWSRRRLVGHVGHQARALCRIVNAARTGHIHPAISEEEYLSERTAATLPARAIRNLFWHSESHLNVEWRDVEASAWSVTVRLPDGGSIPIRETPINRALAVWIHAVDLNTTASFRDFPADFLEWLAVNKVPKMIARRRAADVSLILTERQYLVAAGNGAFHIIDGSMPDLLQWLFGRGARNLRTAVPELLRQSVVLPEAFREFSDQRP